MHTRQGWQDAYDAQMGMWRWLRSERGQRWLGAKFRVEVLDEFKNRPDLIELMGQLFSVEPGRLLGAIPTFVSAEMCDVVGAASETFQPEPLYPSDLLIPTGFLWFERPFTIPDRYDKPVTIAAFSWSPLLGMTEQEIIDEKSRFEILDKGRLTRHAAFEPRDDGKMLNWLTERQQEGSHVDGISICLYAPTKDDPWPHDQLGPPPRIVPMHFTPWWFAMDLDGNRIDDEGKPTGAEWWWKILQTTFRLMQQHISVRHNQQATRPQRREAKRLGFAADDVVVVRLRRESAGTHEAHEAEPANYSHRFIVSGHWRNQFYPASNMHRQIWISPYVKGPEDQPLVVKPRRAVVWSR